MECDPSSAGSGSRVIQEKGVNQLELSKEILFETFDKARETESPFVFVAIYAVGAEEVIAIPAVSFDAKEQFYDKAYNDELVHVMNSQVYIRGLSYGDADVLNTIL